MSAIYGYVNLNGDSASQPLLNMMSDEFNFFPFDSHSQLCQKNVAMGYYGLEITSESHNEILPFYDEALGLYFVADAILDNRDNLISTLKLDNSVPDGRIIFEAYKKWGQDCAKYLLGDFAFVIYEEMTRQLFLVRDHTGNHLLYYTRRGERVFFSTLINPLVKPFDNKEYSEQYIVEFLAIPSVLHEITPGITIYKNVLYVLPANYILITQSRTTCYIYWDPKKIKLSTKYTKENYIAEFKKLFNEAVQCRLRTNGNIGILLSGGLDSSSVCCVAAEFLRHENKSLYSYTSVPKEKNDAKNTICDESFLVQEIIKKNANIIASFMPFCESNSISVMDRELQVAEQPYKYIVNSYWLSPMISKIHEDGCKIILTGTVGNSTISYGNIDSILLEHILHFRFLLLYSNLSSYCKCSYKSRKQLFSFIVKNMLKSILGVYDHNICNNVLKQEYRLKYNISNKLKSFGLSNRPISRFRKTQLGMLSSPFLNHLNAAASKASMINKVLIRDPTSDKRLVEFCTNLPYELYFDVDMGADRGLVRRAMKGIIPDIILNNLFMRGVQGSDWIERIKNEWDNIIDTLTKEIDISTSESIYKYIDIEYLRHLLQRNKYIMDSSFDPESAKTILLIYLCSLFFRS